MFDVNQWLPLAGGLPGILLNAGLKSVVVLVLAWVVLACMKWHSAAARHLVCFLAVASLPLLPLLSGTLPDWRVLPGWMVWRDAKPVAVEKQVDPLPPAEVSAAVSSPPRPVEPAFAATPEISPPAQNPTATTPFVVAAPNPPQPHANRNVNWPRAGWLAWLAGVLLTLTPPVLGLFSLLRLEHASRRETAPGWLDLLAQLLTRLRFQRRVDLLKTAQRRMPMTWGVLRPKVLLPEESEQWPSDRRRVVLLHELGHAQRADYLTHLIARLVCALYWFNPLVWLIARRMVAERERACDDIVLRHGAEPADYAEQVLEISAGLSTGWLASCGGIAMARPSNLESRLRAILDATRNRAALTRAAVVSALLLVTVILVPVAMLKAASDGKAAPVATSTGDSVLERIQWLMQRSPATTNLPAEIWETAPDQPAGYKVRPNVVQYYYHNTGHSNLIDCVVFHLSEQNRFYIQWENFISPDSERSYYGPFTGDPFHVLSPGASATAQARNARPSRRGPLTDPKRIEPDNPLGLDDETIIRFFDTGQALQEIALQARAFPMSVEDMFQHCINRDELGNDPFGDGKLRVDSYQTNGQTMTRVFSVGPEGLWDDGKPVLASDPNLRGDLGVEMGEGNNAVHWLAGGAVLDYLQGTHAAHYLAKKEPHVAAPAVLPPAANTNLQFGPVVDGLRAAVELIPGHGVFVIGAPIELRFHIQNAANYDIQVAGVNWRQGDEMVLEGENGGPVLNKSGGSPMISASFYTGWPTIQRETLAPGQTEVFQSSGLEFVPEGGPPAQNPVGHSVSLPPGRYQIHFKLRFPSGNAQLKDWQGTLETGVATVELKEVGYHAANQTTNDVQYAAGFVPEKSEITLGESNYVTFNLTNTSGRTLLMAVGGMEWSLGGDYRIQVFNAAGERVPDLFEDGPSHYHLGGGPIGATPIEPGGVFKDRIYLPTFVKFETPGEYTIVASRRISLYEDTVPIRQKEHARIGSSPNEISVVDDDVFAALHGEFLQTQVTNRFKLMVVRAQARSDTPASDWGETTNGLRTRLVADKQQFRSGEPITMHIEVENVGGGAKKFQNPAGPENVGLTVLDADGKEVVFIGGPSQVWGGGIDLAAGQNRQLGAFNLADFYHLRQPGRYTVQLPAERYPMREPGVETLPLSGKLTFEVVADAAANADGDPVGHLLPILPKTWALANYPGDMGKVRPGSNREEVAGRGLMLYFGNFRSGAGGTIWLWVTAQPAAERPIPPGDNTPVGEYLGHNGALHVYVSIDAHAHTAWPTAKEDILRALGASPDSNSSDDARWGEPFRGFKIRLRAANADGAGEALPKLFVDIANQGLEEYVTFTNPTTWQLDVDGHKYVVEPQHYPAGNSNYYSGGGALLEVLPDQPWTNLPVPLDAAWREAGPEETGMQIFGNWVADYPTNPPMKLAPGRHTLRQ